MALTHAQRIAWLEARTAELAWWIPRAWTDLTQWTFDGAPLAMGESWPDRQGVHRLAHPPVDGDWDRLELDLGGEGLVRIDGRPFGLDAEHRTFPRVGAVEVEIVARLPFGEPNREPRLARARAVAVDEPVERLVRRLRLVAEAARELGEDIGLVDCAAAALLRLRWPSATRSYLARQAPTEQMRNVWELPPLDPRPPGLDDDARASVADALAALDAGLAALRKRHPPAGALLLTGHAHIDLAWRWPLEETRRKARRTLSTVADLLDRHPELHFNQSAAQLLAFLEEDDPALLARLVEHDRFEPIGGMWVEPDCVMPAGESLVRQLLYGQRWFARTFGALHSVCWLPDCFGFTPALPQLLAASGIRHFFTIKLSWSETNPFPSDLFWWEGLDGTRVLAHMFDNPDGGYNGVLGPRAALGTWRNRRSDHGESLLSVGYGDGGGGPTEEMLLRARDMDDLPALPRQRFGRVDEFFRRAEDDAGPLPTWSGELYLELHRGTLTTQGRTKRLHRRAERDLVAAEALAALAHLAGGSAPASLEPLWRVLLRNQFHDILPGSGIREVYETAEAELASVVAGAAEVSERALSDLLGDDGDSPAVVVANPDLSPRPLRVDLPDGPFTAPVTVAGLETVRVPRGEPAGALDVAPDRLENDDVRVTLAPDGTLRGVFDKRAGREVLDGRGNQVWAYVDKPRDWDAWDVEAGYAEDGCELTATAPPRVVEDGPHRVAVRVERAFRDSRIVREVRLWAGSPRIDFHTRLDWHDRRWLLKARFPLAVRSPRATFETAFGVVERPTHRNTSWDAARFEVAAHRFADLSEPGYGAALLNDGRYGHHALGAELGLSLLRSPVWPDPLADEGEQELVYALLPHAGGWLEGGVLAEAEDLNRPLLARPARGGPAALRPVRIEGLPVGKALEDGGGLLLRVYEPQGARGAVTVDVPGWALSPVDLLERPAGEPGLALGPFAVRGWRLTRA